MNYCNTIINLQNRNITERNAGLIGLCWCGEFFIYLYKHLIKITNNLIKIIKRESRVVLNMFNNPQKKKNSHSDAKYAIFHKTEKEEVQNMYLTVQLPTSNLQSVIRPVCEGGVYRRTPLYLLDYS